MEGEQEMSIFVKSLKEKGLLDQIHITVCNVGSRKLSSGDDYGAGAGAWNVPSKRFTA